MTAALPYRLLADLVLLLHAAIVAFVVLGLVAIVAGGLARWRHVDAPGFRIAHLAAIGIVVAQAWLGVDCPLTLLEAWLRAQAGAPGHGDGFVAHWVGRLLYWQAPGWVFTVGYTLFGLAVAAAWWRFPPSFPSRDGPPGRPRHRKDAGDGPG
jgi:hypothetical protein